MKRSVKFLWKVNGDFSPQGLQKVFLVGHPADTAQRKQITEEILLLFDCAVFAVRCLYPRAQHNGGQNCRDGPWNAHREKLC